MQPGQPIDEMVDGQGGLRPQWRAMLGTYQSLGEGGLRARAARLDRAVADEGAGSAGPWRCDPVPLPLSATEFLALERGIMQRARLMAALAADVYGPMSVLSGGVLPPSLVYGDAAFLRPCREPAGPVPPLTMYAADLARGPDGRWRVTRDRTGGPDGIGLALENRRLMGAVLPEAFRPVQVRHLGSFFELWQDRLRCMAPPMVTDPSLAVLTGGQSDPEWFGHLCLARELAAALVEGGDLTIRGGLLYLKTLAGLRKVDVVLRGVAGRTVDPLELDGWGGVPGLLDAARGGGVVVTNPPGTDLCGGGRFRLYDAELCRTLLGEDLLLPWAEEVAPSVAPTWAGEGLEPRPVRLRLFAIGGPGGTWTVMPGGLAWVEDASPRCKDVWVLAEDRVDIVGPSTQQPGPLAVRRTAGDLPSRVADGLFWLGRTVERLERAARLIRASVARLLRGAMLLPHEAAELGVLIRCLTDSGLIPDDLADQGALPAALLSAIRRKPQLPKEASDGTRDRVTGEAGASVLSLMTEVARLVESVRDRLTADMHASFGEMLANARARAEAATSGLDALAMAMAETQRFCTTVAGAAAENMVRGGGYLFLDLGRRIERAQSVAIEVAAACELPPSKLDIGLSLALELCDSTLTYRGRYRGTLQAGVVLDLVLADPSNPRGLAFQLVAIHGLLDELAPGAIGREALAGAAAGLLAQAEALVGGVLAAPATAGAVPAALRELAERVAELSSRIGRRYFSMLPALQNLGYDTLQGVA